MTFHLFSAHFCHTLSGHFAWQAQYLVKRMHFAYFMSQFPPSLFDTLEVPPLKLHTSGQPMRISQFSECKEHVHHPLRGGHIAVNRPSFVLRACSCGLDDLDIT